MTGWRDKGLRRLGAALAGIALYAQLAFASVAMLALASQTAPANPFGEHALCLAGTATPRPAAPGPAAPRHDHPAFCCLWHLAPALAPTTALVRQPFAYAAIGLDHTGDDLFNTGPRRGPVNARAPPPTV